MGGPGINACQQALSATDPKKPTCSLLRSGFTDSQPTHEVEVNGFWMDEAEVTNDQFQKFIDATITRLGGVMCLGLVGIILWDLKVT